MSESKTGAGYDIAIVGMALRLPGSTTPEQYWDNLKNGIESVEYYQDEDLLAQGIGASQLKNPNYVKAGAPLADVAGFDPEFFGFSPKEAGILDPQHRQFYECSWEALERAGHAPENFDGAIGVFAGSGMAGYFAHNILTNPDLLESVGLFLLRHTGNDKDFLSTRASYNLNLTGPSINVQTACSTSAVATHLACMSLMSGECDMALAGGVTVEIPHRVGYLYKEGEILSPDGHCRPFDHQSKGTIFGSGVGVIALRRLEDALDDNDHIHAIISGSAVNNDGSAKVGYLAPSVEGQAQAITEALGMADLDADSISYVECHGTGTPVGDPIEVAALTQAFRQSSTRNQYCGIGSVKSNIGHLDTAAGIASIIKAALALEHGQIPPSLNYEAPNPSISFDDSPFYVNDQLADWPKQDEPQRAAVNSLGVGGTNAFIILEQPPKTTDSESTKRSEQLFTLSARNRNALDDACTKLADHLEQSADIPIADIAYTLLTGRREFDHRRVFAAESSSQAIDLLRSGDPRRVFTHKAEPGAKSVVFMFPGGGAQYLNMGRDLYRTEAIFQRTVDEGFAALRNHTDLDLKQLLFDAPDPAATNVLLQTPSVQLPAIFIIEYSLAQLWIAMGIKPDALIGHSMGENAAACLAGVMSYADAVGLVQLRGRLMDSVEEGGMLSVQLDAESLISHLGPTSKHPDIELASVNSPGLAVASGPVAALEALEQDLTQQDIECQRVKINIAAHSSMLDPVLDDFATYLKSIGLHAPNIPIVSNTTGTWLTPEQAIDPMYWVQHMRRTVQFAQGIDTLLQEDGRVLLEVGPGNTLGSLARQNPSAPNQRVFSSLRHPDEEIADNAYFTTILGRLWAVGVNVDAAILWPQEKRQKVPLPTYAFQHKDYWINPGRGAAQTAKAYGTLEKIDQTKDWFHKPTWIEQGILPSQKIDPATWLVFTDNTEISQHLISGLREAGHKLITVSEGDAYYRISSAEYRLSPEAGSEGYSALLKDIVASGTIPKRVLHTWLLTEEEKFRPGSSFFHRNQEYGFYSLFFIAKALADEGLLDEQIHLAVLSSGMQRVKDEPLPYPEKATALGAIKLIPREFPLITCSSIDVVVPDEHTGFFSNPKDHDQQLQSLVNSLLIETQTNASNATVAYRNSVRWIHCYDHLTETLEKLTSNQQPRLKQQGVYLITGGLGGVGYVTAKHLANSYSAKLILLNRTPLPDRAEWSTWLKQHAHDDPISRNIRKVSELENSGAQVAYFSGDVTDLDRISNVVEEATTRFGPINGVFHAAGTVNDSLIQIKTQTEIEEVFSPKVYGTLVLDEVFADQPLDFMALFSSTSTAIAPIGQIDYVAANAFLNAYALSKTDPNRYTVAINWGVWNEVGMAAETARNMGYGPTNQAQSNKLPTRYPLFDSHELVNNNGYTSHLFTGHLAPKSHWLLDEHRTKNGQALLPGTAYLELARAALAECDVIDQFEIRDLIFFQAFYVEDNETRRMQIKLTETTEGFDFELQSLVDDATAPGWATHAEARILLTANPQGATDTTQPTSRWSDISPHVTTEGFSGDAQRSSQETHLNFGSRWQVLRHQQTFGDNNEEALALLRLEQHLQSDFADYPLHPGLLDIATGFAMTLIDGYQDPENTNLWVPVSYQRLRYFRSLTSEIVSWARTASPASVADEFVSFDVSLFDSTGNLLVDVQQLTLHQLSGVIDFSEPLQSSEPLAQTASNNELRQLSPAELAFQHNLSQGIAPVEGMTILEQILNGSSEPQIIVSSLDLDGLIEEAGATAASLQPESDGTTFARPDLDNEYVAPTDDLERTIVGFWEELLGVDQVGIEDNFFELGGHSLIAVRLFSKIQQTYEVDYPISILFEAPTIAQCAAMIRQHIEVAEVDESVDEAIDTKHHTRYTHLVPMHGRASSSNAPFFLVAGMFGNVLNLRHLAHLIGSDRPFYGLQARGLYGDHEPHETFEEMARDYIVEMRTVQPKGPYYLGGFSGGGITAFEIAKQLKAAGQEIALMVLLDTPLAQSEPLSSVDRISIHRQRIVKRGPAYFTQWAKDRYQWEMQKFSNRFNSSEEADTPYDFQSENIELAFRRALDLYTIDKQPFKVVLFRPRLDKSYQLSGGRTANADRELVYADNGWTPYLDELDVFEVPGNHDSMVLEPNVRVLATKIANCLNEAEALALAMPEAKVASAG